MSLEVFRKETYVRCSKGKTKYLGKGLEKLLRMRKKCLQGSLKMNVKHLSSWLRPKIFGPEWLEEFFQPSGWMSSPWGLGK